LTKLKEKAKELTRIREKMRAVQEEVSVVGRQEVGVCLSLFRTTPSFMR